MPRKKLTEAEIAEIEEMKRKLTELEVEESSSEEEEGEEDEDDEEDDEPNEAGAKPTEYSQESVTKALEELNMSPSFPELADGQLGCMGLIVHVKTKKGTVETYVSQKTVFVWSNECDEEDYIKAKGRMEANLLKLNRVPDQTAESFVICSSEGFTSLPTVIGGITRSYCLPDLPFKSLAQHKSDRDKKKIKAAETAKEAETAKAAETKKAKKDKK